MWDFLKKIFSERDGDVTVVVIDEQDPNGSSSFKLRAADLVKLAMLVVLISVTITVVMFFATPLGSLYQHQQDADLRQSVLEISDRVATLQDSLDARDSQLANMREILRSSRDTTFAVNSTAIQVSGTEEVPVSQIDDGIQAFEMLSQNEIILSGKISSLPDFPAEPPLEGTQTQGYDASVGHYGLDIAARPGTEFRVVADGTVIDNGWSVNYGYIIYVQHADGIMSVYKHGARLSKQKGDYVLKGDILGVIGDAGVLSSGSHLHLEIWKNGVPQNPSMYLLN
ncbi:MAG: M23 family metallopeptidase [Balneolaceae bacterium]|nr:M23 family metallopeptidase [Balneolaceae bacterium]